MEQEEPVGTIRLFGERDQGKIGYWQNIIPEDILKESFTLILK